MSSSYSNSLRIELIGSGDQAGTWGTTTNSNLAFVLDTAIAGYQPVTVSSTAQALTYLNGASSTAALNQSIYAMLKFTGASATSSIYAPPVPKTYIIWNDSGYTINIFNSTVIGGTSTTGTGVAITNNTKMMVWSDGLNFYEVQAQTLAGTLPVANGGTGATTAAGARTNLGLVIGTDVAPVASPAFTGNPTAPTPVTTDNDTSIATTAFVQAVVRTLYPVGSIYSSTASTDPTTLFGFGVWSAFAPGRVMIGAGGGYTAGDTGGSANAVIVDHTHGFSGTSGTMNSNTTHTHASSYSGFLENLPGAGDTLSRGGSQGYRNVSTTEAANIDHTHNFSGTTAGANGGVSGTNANLQPYIVVYMWQRIS